MAKKLPARRPPIDPKIIEFLQSEARVRQSEIETRQMELKLNSELELKALSNASEKDSREFQAYLKEQEFAVRRFYVNTAIIAAGILMGFGILIVSLWLAISGNPLGIDLLKVTLSFFTGMAAGWGITKSKKS